MPKIKLDHTTKGVVQETGKGLFLFRGTQSLTANNAADTTIIDAAGGTIVNVTSGGAARIVHLPAISAETIGLTFLLVVGANGFELRGHTETTDLLNQASGGAAVELAVAANSAILCVCTSATNWAVLSDAAPSVAS